MAQPRIITARSMRLRFHMNQLAGMGPERFVTGHYSDTPRARDFRSGIRAALAFHRFHQVERGWAGLAYHYVIPDDGSIICGRPVLFNGAHVAGHNRQNVGVNMPGTTGDRPTHRQARAFNWLLHHAHTDAMPRSHRTDVDLSTLPRRGHKQWPGQATGCPGLFLGMYRRGGVPFQEGVLGGGPADEAEEFIAPSPEDEDVPEPPRPPESVHGTTVADGIHVSPEEAEEMENTDPNAEGELPEADERFDEDLSDILAEIEPGTGR